MTSEKETGISGQLFEDFLRKQGTFDDTAHQAIRRVLAFQLAALMDAQAISKVEMARRLETTRSQLDKLLDPDNHAVTLAALARTAKAVGRRLLVALE